MASRKSKKTAVSWTASICLVAAAPLVTGCMNDGTNEDSKKPASSSSKPASGATPDSHSGKQSSDAGRKGSGSGPRQGDRSRGGSTAQEAVTRWITAIVENRPDMACKVMTAPAAHGGPQAGDAGKCGDTNASAQQIKKRLRGFHASFTPRNPHNPPKVEVHGAAPSGHTAEFPGDRITIDGQNLNTVVYSNSKGVSKDGIDIKVSAMELQNRWYVNDLDMKIG